MAQSNEPDAQYEHDSSLEENYNDVVDQLSRLLNKVQGEGGSSSDSSSDSEKNGHTNSAFTEDEPSSPQIPRAVFTPPPPESSSSSDNVSISTISEKVDQAQMQETSKPDYAPPQYSDIIADSGYTKEELDKKIEAGSIVSESDLEDDDNDEPERMQWNNQVEFLLSLIAMSVGLGNVWRFPYIAYKNGGGAFLIPYLIVLIFVGRPIYYLEMCLGQFYGKANVKMWNMAPIFYGVGYGQFVIVICIAIYYAYIMALNAFYFFHSFFKILPWTECNPEWVANVSLCLTPTEELINCTYVSPTDGQKCMSDALESASTLYFENYVTKMHPYDVGLNAGIGHPDWVLTLCLLFCWTANTLILIKGVESSGRVAYFTAIFPYIVLIILLVQGALLPGAKDGVIYFFKPQWSSLKDLKVWYEAATQAFYSLTVGMGGIVMYSSFNPFRHNTFRDSVIISIMDTFTSIMAGTITFCILGNLAQELHSDIEDVVESGVGLVFVTYPDALGRFKKIPQFFSVLFFLMMFTLGAGSSVADTSTVITVICDNFPKFPRWIITVIICAVFFLVGIIFTTPGGMYIMQLFDFYGGGFPVFILVMFEVIGVAYIYGLNRWCTDVEFMLNRRPGWYWKICWGVVIPVFLMVVLLYTFIKWVPLDYGGYVYTQAQQAPGWVVIGISLLVIVIWGIKRIRKAEGDTFWEKLKTTTRPTKKWGPKDKSLKKEWKQFHAERDTNGIWG